MIIERYKGVLTSTGGEIFDTVARNKVCSLGAYSCCTLLNRRWNADRNKLKTISIRIMCVWLSVTAQSPLKREGSKWFRLPRIPDKASVVGKQHFDFLSSCIRPFESEMRRLHRSSEPHDLPDLGSHCRPPPPKTDLLKQIASRVGTAKNTADVQRPAKMY